MKLRILLATAACAAFAAGASLAQPAPPPPGEGGMDHARMEEMHERMAGMHERMEHRRAEHAKALHDALNIRPNQEAAFTAFIDSMKPPAGKGMDHAKMKEGREAMAAMTTPQRLDRMIAEMDAHAAERRARLVAHATAVKAFYGQLDPAQRKTFDALPHLMGGHMGHGEGRGEGHGGGMGRMGRPPHPPAPPAPPAAPQ